MNEETLIRIRELEGLVEFDPQATIITREPKRPCPFAEIISYTSDKLFHCTYKKSCDSQRRYGTSKVYCEEYYCNKTPSYEDIQKEKYGEEAIKQMQERH